MSSEDRITPRRGVAYAPRVPSPRAFAMMGQTGVVAQASYGMTDSGSGISLGALQSSMPGLTAPLTVTDLLHMQQQAYASLLAPISRSVDPSHAELQVKLRLMQCEVVTNQLALAQHLEELKHMEHQARLQAEVRARTQVVIDQLDQELARQRRQQEAVLPRPQPVRFQWPSIIQKPSQRKPQAPLPYQSFEVMMPQPPAAAAQQAQVEAPRVDMPPPSPSPQMWQHADVQALQHLLAPTPIPQEGSDGYTSAATSMASVESEDSDAAPAVAVAAAAVPVPVGKPKRTCKAPNCNRLDKGRGFCKRHGGGRRCRVWGCTKSSRGSMGTCIEHGGGPRCLAPFCRVGARTVNGFCKAHGGARKCSVEGCFNTARGCQTVCGKHLEDEFQTASLPPQQDLRVPSPLEALFMGPLPIANHDWAHADAAALDSFNYNYNFNFPMQH